VLSTNGDPPRTGTLLTGRLILSVGGPTSGAANDVESSGAPTITLLVSPGEAELLAQAACAGEISVSLCPTDSEAQTSKKEQ
jgi:hypothetical protein